MDKIKIHNTSYFNKSPASIVASAVWLDWLTDIKIKRINAYKLIVDIFTYLVKPAQLKSLKDTQIRLVEGYIYNRNKVSTVYKMEIPVITKYPEIDIQKHINEITKLIENIRNYKHLDIFYITRKAEAEDYADYIRWLKTYNKRFVSQAQELDRFKQIQAIGELLEEIISDYECQVREGYIIISEDVGELKPKSVLKKIEMLKHKEKSIKNDFREVGVELEKIEDDNLNQFLIKNISNKI